MGSLTSGRSRSVCEKRRDGCVGDERVGAADTRRCLHPAVKKRLKNANMVDVMRAKEMSHGVGDDENKISKG